MFKNVELYAFPQRDFLFLNEVEESENEGTQETPLAAVREYYAGVWCGERDMLENTAGSGRCGRRRRKRRQRRQLQVAKV